MKPDFYTGKKLCLSVLALLIMLPCLAISPDKTKEAKNKRNVHSAGAAEVPSVNVKLSPSFFWSTLGAEVEYKLNNTYTISLNGFYKFGRTDGSSTHLMANNELHLSNGMRAEVALRYFPGKSAPAGLYYQGHIGIGNILYHDGTNRPFTLNSPRKQGANTRELVPYDKPQPYSGGIGIGYQFVLPSRRLIANLNGGVQTNFSATHRPYFSLFFSPSIGFIF